MANGPFFKFVDLKDAGVVEAGSVRIGTLRGYAALESERRDANEHTRSFRVDELTETDPNAARKAAAFGIRILPGANFTMQNMSVRHVGRDAFCFCMSTTLDGVEPDAFVNQAVFRIDDIDAWVGRVWELYPLLGRYADGNVVYEDRDFDPVIESLPELNPFQKPVSFSKENEYRVVWEGEPDAVFEPFNTKVDPELASLMVRLKIDLE